ncbi:2-O-methyltransferase NoeI [Novipirellula artificiosorum]|uniref:2-O-methyltransferase NoeI n=2 Tax=Novipirellula artificiosorum TaxID=2528016 RepID=A0A5C6DLM2_9BACT|nr:2-O-methyltransferase NoeI [Novipirellula artificiosorum]
MIRQIDDFPSFFEPSDERPLIIDCGANIGVSMLEWKHRWPQAEILCFEPDPFAFAILCKNVEANDIPGVRCLNLAVADSEGTTPWYGNISASGDARGNSIDPAWGDRTAWGINRTTTRTTVQCVPLSIYLSKRTVSFLKLDIEGAEEQVINESAECLGNVEAVYVEVHQTKASESYNSSGRIHKALEQAGFVVEAESRFQQHALPPHLEAWQRDTQATQTQLLAWR